MYKLSCTTRIPCHQTNELTEPVFYSFLFHLQNLLWTFKTQKLFFLTRNQTKTHDLATETDENNVHRSDTIRSTPENMLTKDSSNRTRYHQQVQAIAEEEAQNDKKVRMKHILKNLEDTEINYVNSLYILLASYKKPLESPQYENLLTANERYQLFKHIPAIHSQAANFLTKISTEIQNYTDTSKFTSLAIAELISDYLSNESVQISLEDYLYDYEKSHDIIKRNQAKRNRLFQNFCLDRAKDSGRNDILSLYARPFQRVPRYALLLKDMIKNAWDDDMKTQLEAVNDTVEKLSKHLNQCKAEADKRDVNFDKLQQIVEHVTHTENLADHHSKHPLITYKTPVEYREFLFKYAPDYLKNNNKPLETSRHIWIFTDVIMNTICRESHNRTSHNRKSERFDLIQDVPSISKVKPHEFCWLLPLDAVSLTCSKEINHSSPIDETSSPDYFKDVQNLQQIQKILDNMSNMQPEMTEKLRMSLSQCKDDFTEKYNQHISANKKLLVTLTLQWNPRDILLSPRIKNDKFCSEFQLPLTEAKQFRETFDNAKQAFASNFGHHRLTYDFSETVFDEFRLGFYVHDLVFKESTNRILILGTFHNNIGKSIFQLYDIDHHKKYSAVVFSAKTKKLILPFVMDVERRAIPESIICYDKFMLYCLFSIFRIQQPKRNIF